MHQFSQGTRVITLLTSRYRRRERKSTPVLWLRPASDVERWVDLPEGYAACLCQGHESLLFCGSGYTNIDELIEEGGRFRPAFDRVSAPDIVSTT